MKFREIYMFASDFCNKLNDNLLAMALFQHICTNCTDNELVKSAKNKMDEIKSKEDITVAFDNVMSFREEMNVQGAARVLEQEVDFYSFMTVDELQSIRKKIRSKAAHTLERTKEELLSEYSKRYRNQMQEKYKWLINENADCYYEYKVISVSDTLGGGADIERLTATLNSLALEGWRLRTAVTNELGKNAVSVGGIGINSTADQTVLIMERRVSIKEYMED